MKDLQEVFERIYDQQKPKKQPKLNIKGAVILTTKEINQLNKHSKNEIFLVS